MRTKNRNGNFLAVLLVIAACGLTTSAQESGAPNAESGDEAAIRENVRQMESGWNTKSGALFAKPFAENADYVIINGMHIQGREAIDKGHRRIFETIYKDSVISLSVKQIRFLRPHVAVVHVTGHNKFRQGEETHEIDAIITMVMAKEMDGWKIAAFQNTQVVGNRRR